VTRVSIPALRRQMLARGLSTRPICPDCREPHRPRDFHKSGVCGPCARKAAALRRIEVIDHKLVTLWAASREVTDPATLELIDSEMHELEGERMELWFTEVEPEERSHA
jgi:hypothetical protein